MMLKFINCSNNSNSSLIVNFLNEASAGDVGDIRNRWIWITNISADI